MPVVSKGDIPRFGKTGRGASIYENDVEQTLKLGRDQAWKLEYPDRKPHNVRSGAMRVVKAKGLERRIKVVQRGNDVFMYQV